MLTYLLASNVTLWQVGLIRAISTVLELSATWIAPRLMRHIGVLRTGLWSIGWQITWLAAGVTWLFYFYGRGVPLTTILPAAGLATAVALSRVGLWGFDLSAQNIVQDVRQSSIVSIVRCGSELTSSAGSPGRSTRYLLHRGDVIPEPIRHAVMGADDHLVGPWFFPMASACQLRICLYSGRTVCVLPEETEGPSHTSFGLFGPKGR
jgi:hypothetical protein